MLTGLAIRDLVLVKSLALEIGPGLTVLTGETGAGKSILLDALGLATGRRAEGGLIRQGAAQATASAEFSPPASHPVFAYLEERGLPADPGEGVTLRRQLSADGRSRAFVNDQPVGVGMLRELGALLLEVHGQHDAVGLLDIRTHRPLLDAFGGLEAQAAACEAAWTRLSVAREVAAALKDRAARSAEEADQLTARLAELDRLDPRVGEEAALAEERALLGAAEKALADIEAARTALGGDALASRLAQGFRALARARERTVQAGAGKGSAAAVKLVAAEEAVDRALTEAAEATEAIDAAAAAFSFEPDRLEKAEERLFALRAAARKLDVLVDDLPVARVRMTESLRGLQDLDAEIEAAEQAVDAMGAAYRTAAEALSSGRHAAGDRLAEAVEAELKPLKLDKARFRVAVQPLPDGRAGPKGADRVEFQIATNPGAPFAALGAIASGGELARFALALKVVLAARAGGGAQTMLFDEVDQGVGGAVADAVGQRLKRLAEQSQVILVTHSPQVAARADAHWRVSKAGANGEGVLTEVETLAADTREEEIARMLSGAYVTDAARAAARALIGA